MIESGPAPFSERFLEHLYQVGRPGMWILLSCYTDVPSGFDINRGRSFFTHQATTASARNDLFRDLAKRGYSAVCVLCTGDPIMTKWKWMAAARVPSKVLIVNENIDFYWLDIHHWRSAKAMLRHRMGLHGTGPFRIIADVFTLSRSTRRTPCLCGGRPCAAAASDLIGGAPSSLGEYNHI